MTSGDVTIQFLLRHRPGKTVYLVGTPQLEKQFADSGIVLTEDAEIVVSSFDTTLTYKKLDTACRLIRGGAEYLSTHPDFNCPTEDGFIPDSGAISAFITASTGVTPTYFGKPYKETLEMIIEQTGRLKGRDVHLRRPALHRYRIGAQVRSCLLPRLYRRNNPRRRRERLPCRPSGFCFPIAFRSR
jgi:4-nitrophenyl phosphatase